MKLKKELWVVVLFIVTMNILNAQPSMGIFTVKGKVLEQETQQPLEYVNVVIYSMRDSSLVAGTITSNDGTFEVVSKRPGKYYLTADFIGYEKQYVKEITLKPGSESFNTGKIHLKQTNLGIEEVEVVGERPFVSYQIDKKVIDVSRNPLAQGGTAVEALENVPSIETDIEGNVSVRGSSEFTVLIDGRQSPITGSDALKQIPASAIDKIEIITNPSVKYDPDGTAGIINIITKKGKLKGHSLSVNTSVGSSPMGSVDVNYTYRMKKANLYAGVGYRDFRMNFETFDERTTTDTLNNSNYIRSERTGEMQHGNISLKGGMDYFLSNNNTISLGLNYNTFKFGRSFDSKIRSISDTTTYQVSSTGYKVNPYTLQFTIGDKHEFGGNSEHYLTVDFLYQSRQGDTDDELFFSNSNSDWIEIDDALKLNEKALTSENARRARLEVNYALPVSDNLKIEAGYTMRMDRSDKDYKRFLYNEESNGFVPNSEFDDKSNYSRDIHAVWALAKGKMFGVGYSFGLRGESTNRETSTEKEGNKYVYNYFGLYPSAAVTKEWENGHTLQANYSRRINRPRDWHLNPFPALSDGYTAQVPNPELEPEYSSALEVNYQKAWGSQFIALETFYRHTTNEIDRVYEIVDDTLLVRTMINLGEESRIGGELGGNVKVTKWWGINPVVTLYYYNVEGNYNNEYQTKSSTNTRVSLTNNFTLSSKTRIQLMGNYRGPSVSIDGDRQETYWVSAAFRQSFLDRKLTAVFRVDDIFGTRKRAGTSVSVNQETGSRTVTYSEGQRRSPMFVLSLNLNLNQNGNKRNGRNSDDGGEGGMDMEF